MNHPSHYTTGTIEVLDFILDQKFGFLDGQVIKYVSRCRHKNNALEDLRKAEFYLKKLIARYEATVPDAELARVVKVEEETKSERNRQRAVQDAWVGLPCQ